MRGGRAPHFLTFIVKIAELFKVQKAAISKHLKNIFESGKLNEDAVVSKMETTAADGKHYKTNYYNLEHLLKVIRIVINSRHFIVPDGFLYNLKTFVGMFFDILPPEMNDSVSEKKQFFVILPVTGTVTFNFFNPIIRIIPFFESHFQAFPVFTMEKFTVTKNSDFIFSKYNIWRSGKGFVIFTVPISFVP